VRTLKEQPMPVEVYLVKVGMNMTEGIVEEWCVPDGATVQRGEILYRLETEKVNLDVDAEASGVVKHLVAVGVPRQPGDVIGYIYPPGETVPELAPRAGDGPTTTESPAGTPPTAPTPAALAGPRERILASPAARRRATELGIALDRLRGSGPGGRIVEADVDAAVSATASTPADATHVPTRASPRARRHARELGVELASVAGSGPGGRITGEDVDAAAGNASQRSDDVADQRIPLSSMRRTIARRMHESLTTMAQLTMNMDVTMDDAIRLREQLVEEWSQDGVRPGYTDLVIRAVAKALRRHPEMNARFEADAITRLGAINVGLAVALDEGLIVPVVHGADRLDMRTLAATTARLAAAARDGTLRPDDVTGGTFTVTALGMFGVDSFTPIINAPQAGILGINRIRDEVRFEGSTALRTRVLRLSLSWDHRVLDGAPAARFLGTVRELLEAPYRLLV
jgi:pyruvate dehydrogenase E2 component (dihydrolipoamide acetyltransferase)